MLSITVAGIDALDEAMTVMGSAFDPCFGEAWTASQCAGMLAMPGAVMLVAREVDAIGFALLRVVTDEAELMLIAVRPDARGRGVGRALLRESLACALQHGARACFLEVRHDNPAIALYAREGLVVVGQRRNYYLGNDGVRRDGLTLRKSLG